MRQHLPQVLDARPGQAQQAVLDGADHLGGDRDTALGEQIVGDVDAAGGGVLDRQQGEVGVTPLHRLDCLAERLVAGEQRPAAASAVAVLRREMTVGAFDALVSDAQRRRVEAGDEALLAGHRHLHELPVEALDLVRVEAHLGGGVAHSLQHELLAQPVAQRRGRFELGRRHTLHDFHARPQQLQDPPVEPFELLAQRLQVGLRHRRRVYAAPPARDRRMGPP